MTNKEISRALKLTAALGELYGENEFKLKSLNNSAFQIDRAGFPLAGKTVEELLQIPGIGKSIALKITELLETGTTAELQDYIAKTPPGIIELLSVKGVGAKKVAALWRKLGIETPGELLYACYENRLVELKGFGAKTQENIKQALEYLIASTGKLHYAEAELVVNELTGRLRDLQPTLAVEPAGELRRQLETIEGLLLVAAITVREFSDLAAKADDIVLERVEGGTVFLSFRERYSVEVHCVTAAAFATELLRLTGPAQHLAEAGWTEGESPVSEEAFYTSRSLPCILPALRDLSLEQARRIDPAQLVGWSDIKGILHNHTTWSDGAHTLRDMALYCKSLGMEYLGICDHSRSAIYAGGLSIERVMQQQAEIDLLNAELTPFRILKGIESDILTDGSLDYPGEVLASFDLVVASVHSVLRMDEEKATRRLIRAIENPYTTILGHPTGRLLLSRQGYPVDHTAIIDACAANGVVIELNAHPFRLDIDWRWIPYCLEKGVLISINPDAHKKEGYHDMQYGINVARKGGLVKTALFNGKSLAEIEQWLHKRKK